MAKQSIVYSNLHFVGIFLLVGCDNVADNFSNAPFVYQMSNSTGSSTSNTHTDQETNSTVQSGEYYTENNIDSEANWEPQQPANGCTSLHEDWPSEWGEVEFQVLEMVNQHRLEGYTCGSRGYFAATSLLVMNECLQQAARLHAEDMALEDYFSHESLDGRFFADRISETGYGEILYGGENIAANYKTAQKVVEGWLNSDSHCENIMNANFHEIGIGYYHADMGEFHEVWVQKFATQK